MENRNGFKLIFQSKTYEIPSNFRFFEDVDENIYSILISKGEYQAHSEAGLEVFKSFLNHWITQELPDINSDNFLEYLSLSTEFDRMQDILTFYRNQTTKYGIYRLKALNSKLKEQYTEKKSKLIENSENFKKTIEVLFSSHGIDTRTKFLELKKQIFQKCKEGDYQSVSHLVSTEYFSNNCLYKINEYKKTATIDRMLNGDNEEVFIPRSTKYKNEEFVIESLGDIFYIGKDNEIKRIKFDPHCEIQSIGSGFLPCNQIESFVVPSSVTLIKSDAFATFENLKEIIFLKDSKLKKIEPYAFASNNLEILVIPSSVEELEEGWCQEISNLINIKVIENQTKNIKIFEDKFLIGKTDIKSDNFDVLLFARRDIKNAIIPSFIKKIDSCSFEYCSKLESIEFSDDSELFAIGWNAFSFSNLKSFYFPSKVTLLEKEWCNNTSFINFKINENNKNFLYFDDKFLLGKSNPKNARYNVILYARRDIKKAIIPSFIQQIAPYSFQIKEFFEIEFSDDSELTLIDDFAFNESALESIKIPNKTIKIGKYAFTQCALQKIDFSDNSQLTIIDDYSFYINNSLERLAIPSHVVQIGRYAFKCNYNLVTISFSQRSELKIINDSAFSDTSFEEITIPSHVVLIDDNSLARSSYKEIKFAENSELQSINRFALGSTGIENIDIPSSVTNIGPFCFLGCKLKNFSFLSKVLSKEIKKGTFSQNPNFDEITIPSQVIKIGKEVFYECTNLKKVHIPIDSELRSISSFAFHLSKIESLYIPSKLVELKDGWCSSTYCLVNIEISEKNSNFIYYQNKFLLGKSKPKSNVYDILLFARRDINVAIIPSFIKEIASYAFDGCRKLKKLEFPNDSKLEIIGKNSFLYSKLKYISIPCHVKVIHEYAFCGCESETILFQKNSELKHLGKSVFKFSKLKKIIIPAQLERISKNMFARCEQIEKVEFEKNSKLVSIGRNAFSFSKISSFSIPENVTDISYMAFNNATNLQILEFSRNNELIKIHAQSIWPLGLCIMIPANNK